MDLIIHNKQISMGFPAKSRLVLARYKCSGIRARDRDKSKQHLMVYSTNPRTSPYTSTKRMEGINPIESAFKPQLYILITA